MSSLCLLIQHVFITLFLLVISNFNVYIWPNFPLQSQALNDAALNRGHTNRLPDSSQFRPTVKVKERVSAVSKTHGILAVRLNNAWTTMSPQLAN